MIKSTLVLTAACAAIVLLMMMLLVTMMSSVDDWDEAKILMEQAGAWHPQSVIECCFADIACRAWNIGSDCWI